MPSLELELGFLRPARRVLANHPRPSRTTLTCCNIRQVSKDSLSAGTGGDVDNLLDDDECMRAENLGFDVRPGDASTSSDVVDLYALLMKQDLGGFVAAMVAAPVMLSLVFTLLYAPAFRELCYQEEMFRDMTVFQIFMFSISLCTGMEPVVSPESPYTIVLANVNALLAQLLFVFLSGAVFQRLSQPSQPIKCSTVAIISQKSLNTSKNFRVFMARFVLTGPQPCELVDVKIELTFKYTFVSKSGRHGQGMQPLKLVRKSCFYLNYGMLVRHVINEDSPLYNQTPELLLKQDAVISLGVVGIERFSMQPVFHTQHYCARDGHIIWDARFNDMILVNESKNGRIVDHSRLGSWHL